MFLKPLVRQTGLLALAFILLPITTSDGQTMAKKAIATNLNHPSGVAIHPVDGSVYVADSGHGNILRLKDGKTEVVVSDYPVTDDPKILNTVGGPQGLGFLENGKHLIVGSGGWTPDLDRVDVYLVDRLPTNSDSAHISAQLTAENTPDKKTQADFFGIACDTSTAWITGRGSPDSGWVYEFPAGENETKPTLRCGFSTWESTQTRYPTALAISPAGFLLVGLRGDLKQTSALGFFDRGTGQLRAKFDIGVPGIIALDYHPITGKLFALINNPNAPDDNGLYKLVARKRNTICEAKLQIQIQDPWAMAFSKEGDLWVTSGRDSGTLWQISPSSNPEEQPQ